MKKTLSIFVFHIVLILNCSNIEAQFQLIEVLPGFNYADWYKAATGYTPNPQWFGAWVIAPHNDELYFGFATARPAESDGGLLAKWTGDSLVSLGQFDEQGVHCLLWNKDTLYSMGSDPSRGDGWDGGNFYKYNPENGFVKMRYNDNNKPILPNVVHSWGLCFDTISNRLYMGTGSYDPVQYSKNGNNQCGNANDSTLACFGEIWQSSNYGYSWELISGKKPDVISTFRAMDVITYNNNIYEFNANADTPSDLKKSSDNGQTWTVVPNVNLYVLWRMCVFQNKLLAGADVGGKLYVIDENTSSSTITLPGAFNYSFNVFANVDDRYLITYFTDGSVYATPDLSDWIQLIPPTGKKFLSIAYWENKQSIVLAERDSIGKIWKVDISELLAIGIEKEVNKNEYVLSISRENVSIKNIDMEVTNIDLFNILGINVSKLTSINRNLNNININTSQLPPGVYLIVLNHKGKYNSFKFIK
ncbi:MAG: T9SS type A sorting domain-containing protein [bacterium]